MQIPMTLKLIQPFKKLKFELINALNVNATPLLSLSILFNVESTTI